MHHNPSGTPPERTYYSFDWGPGHFVSVDANCGYPIAGAPVVDPGSEQWTWLDRDLASSTAPWKIVFLHIPPYASGGHGFNARLAKNLGPLFEKRGVDVVFQGHDHDYERTYPIVGGSKAERGPIYVTVGTGGAPLYHKTQEHSWTEVFKEVHGFLEVLIEPRKLRATGTSADGSTFDNFEIMK